MLHQKAEIYVKSRIKRRKPKYFTCTELYRTKSLSYFTNIKTNHNNIMKLHLKDSSGDKFSPINGRIMGLFFAVNINFRTGQPFPNSPYGDRRLHIQAHELLTHDTRLYFADFYCRLRPVHYVTLVITKRGSTADIFCSRHLYELDKTLNPFARFSGTTIQVTRSGVRVELFYTENVDIAKVINTSVGRFTDVINNGGKFSVSKPLDCHHCNITNLILERNFANLRLTNPY